MSSLTEVKVVNNQNKLINEERNEMEKYKNDNVSYPRIIHPIREYDDLDTYEGRYIIFNKDDGKCGMIVSLEEIVDVWLDNLKPEKQSRLELEQIHRSEKRELAILKKENKQREKDQNRNRVQNMLKPFLIEQILKVLNKRGLELNKTNIRSLIKECKENFWYTTKINQYNPRDILFTEKEWDAFREQCNQIFPNGGVYDDYKDTYLSKQFTCILTELRNEPISKWKGFEKLSQK